MAAAGESASTRASGRRSGLSNLAWLLGDKLAALLLGLVIQGLIARGYGPSGTGHFAYAMVLLQLGLGLSMVCAGVALLPRFCRARRVVPGALANLFVLRLFASLASVAAMWLFCLATISDPARLRVSMVLVATVPLIEPFYLFATYWQSRNHNRPTVMARSLGLLLRTGLVALGAWLGVPIWLLALAWIVDSAFNAVLQSAQIRGVFAGRSAARQVRWSRILLYLRYGLRFVLGLALLQLFLRIDRLVMAEFLDVHDFGLYAAPMQLVEVWSQIAYLVGSAIAPAYLYQSLRGPGARQAFAKTAGMLAGVGLAGLLGAWLLGAWLLHVVYGPAFDSSHAVLVAGAASAVFVFADQAVDLTLMATNHARWLTIKWGAACAVCLAVVALGHASLGVLAGPLGIACGLASGWLAVAALWRRAELPRPRAATLRGECAK